MFYHQILQEFSTRIDSAKVKLSCPNICTLILFVESEEGNLSMYLL